MRIVIAGAGDVGVYLARMLSQEKHQVILMDTHEDNLEFAKSHYEILTYVGSCSVISDLKGVDVSKTDLFIAVTDSEDSNMTGASLAKLLGAGQVVARVNNQEFIFEENQELLSGLGIDEFVYPEALASNELVSSLKITGAHLIHEFSDKGMQLFSATVQEHSVLADKTLKEIREAYPSSEYRAVAIKRDGETIIPKGHHRFGVGDVLFIISQRETVEEARELCGCEEFKLRNIMIMGGSRIGQRTAKALESKYNVKLIEKNRDKSLELADRLNNTLVVCGDGRNIDLLKEEGIASMDVFIAVTGNPETNIFSCLLAKKMGVKSTIAEVENIDYMDFADTIGVETMINKKLITASSIYKHTTKAEITHFKQIAEADADIMEVVAKEGAYITKAPIKDLNIVEGAIIGAIVREGKEIIAFGDTQVQAGDRVVVFLMPHLIKKVEKMFN